MLYSAACLQNFIFLLRPVRTVPYFNCYLSLSLELSTIFDCNPIYHNVHLVKDVQCYELFGGIALKNHAFSFSMNSKQIKFSEKRSIWNFHECWTNQYGVIERNSKALCILCKEQVVSRTWNVKRHCEANHMWLLKIE